jgi:hypothetical protein
MNPIFYNQQRQSKERNRKDPDICLKLGLVMAFHDVSEYDGDWDEDWKKGRITKDSLTAMDFTSFDYGENDSIPTQILNTVKNFCKTIPVDQIFEKLDHEKFCELITSLDIQTFYYRYSDMDDQYDRFFYKDAFEKNFLEYVDFKSFKIGFKDWLEVNHDHLTNEWNIKNHPYSKTQKVDDSKKMNKNSSRKLIF